VELEKDKNENENLTVIIIDIIGAIGLEADGAVLSSPRV
jgi:hypothetical protein